jgi:putative GTP pyrophosphokinase
MTDLEDVRKQWLEERETWQQFGSAAAARLKEMLRRRGIWANVSSRAKEIDSLIKKLINKPNHTYDSLGDKVGVRVIVRYVREVESAMQIAHELFTCAGRENKLTTLGPDKVGYLSTHVDIRLKGDDPLASQFSPVTYHAELQVRTMAQHLWADMAHDTFYKNDETLNPVPMQLKRRVNVLAGVVEVADNEFDRLSAEIPEVPEVMVLRELERSFLALATKTTNVELSLKVIRLLFPLYGVEPRQLIPILKDFFRDREPVLQAVYADAEVDEARSAFLYQPEALMIYHLLERKPIATHERWNSELPERELERIATAFGMSLI